jgi:hypothetical protein
MTDPAYGAIDERMLRDSPFSKNALKPLVPPAAGPTAAPPAANANPFSLEAPAAPAAPPQANPFSLEAGPAPSAVAAPVPDRALSDVPAEAAHNFIPSLKKTVGETIEGAKAAGSYAYEHPGEVLSNLPAYPAKLGEAILSHYVDTYGSWSNAKKEAAENPVGFLMDAIPLLGPLGKLGKAGKAIQGLDPAKVLDTVKSAAKVGGDAAAKVADGLVASADGVGSGAISKVFDSGKEITPGTWKALTGGLDVDKSYDMIKDVLSQKFEARSQGYIDDMAKVASADKPVDFARVDKAVQDATKIGAYKAPLDTSPGVGYRIADAVPQEMRAAIEDEINKFKAMGPDYHTAVGFDKLKQSIYNLGEGQKVGSMPTAASAYAGKVAAAVRKTIIDAVPDYGDAMKAYEAKTDSLQNLMKEFSLGDKASKMSAIRQMQKVWRQQHVDHGIRNTQLKEAVEGTGNENLMSHLAADQFKSWAPRGLRGVGIGLELPIAAGHAAISPMTGLPHLGMALSTAAMMSPRLAGTAAYGLGRVAGSVPARAAAATYRGAQRVAPNAFRSARLAEPQLDQNNSVGMPQPAFSRSE